MLDTLIQDLRYAVRGVRAKPAFAIAVVGTIALGIGANTAMFGIVDRMLFRPPALMTDIARTHRVYLSQVFRGSVDVSGVDEYAQYQDLARWTTSFERTAVAVPEDLAVGTGEAAREMPIGAVSASFFDFFNAPPVLGRYFGVSDDQTPAGAPVVVLGNATWHVVYGGRPDVLGTTVHIGSVIYTVVGVAPEGFVGIWPDHPPAYFIPVTSYGSSAATGGFLRPGTNWWTTYSWGWLEAMLVRRKPGVSVGAANADLARAAERSYAAERVEQTGEAPASIAHPTAFLGSILSQRGPNASNVSKVATWTAGVALIVLLIACANVANLLLARAIRRRREIAVRLALGVSRGRLVSQLLVESLLLALLGGAASVLVAQVGGLALRTTLMPGTAPTIAIADPRTLIVTAVAVLVVGLVAGLAPIAQARRVDLAGDLCAGVREGTFQRSTLRTGLLLLQGALSVTLLVGAGVFVRSLRNVEATRLGYDVDPVALVDLNMRGETIDSAARVALLARLLDHARRIPGVEGASRGTSVPFWSRWSTSLFVAGIDSVRKLGRFDLNAVSGDFFSTVGTRVLRGRPIASTDTRDAPRVVVVSDAMGRVLWPGKNPVGQCLRVRADTSPCFTVVGVAENIADRDFTGEKAFYYYVSAPQFAPDQGGLFVRTVGPAVRSVDLIRRALQRDMPGASYVNVTPFATIIGEQRRAWKVGAATFVAFGLLALVLAAVGLYSVIAYTVEQRTHEMGIRVALGAQRADLLRLVVAQGIALGGAGLVIGAGIALAGGRWLQPLLFRESAHDPVVFGGNTVVLLSVTIAASWIPARRAARVDPIVSLRSD
ncbi:MAG TPA: ADOP family duplicated permease [Gemmatimonadaceae bacterium]|nr:ADOP family duplicated permease [Gemmatimonadaceae bacterium]